ncbi:MAG: 16S rRNA processing protein RimM [Bacteroidetes bacterium]|nr:MAG: 16S rRNA processing protein RimM [Bacteroidota bacterium]
MKVDDCFTLGVIAKSIGLNGEVGLKLDTDNPQNYTELESVFVEINNEPVPFFIERISIDKRGYARIKFEGIDTPLKAEELIRKRLLLPLSLLPRLTGKSFYYHEVVGFTVEDTKLGTVGKITDVIETGQAILVVNQDEKEILIPAIDDFIVEIDRKNKVFKIQVPSDLIELYLNND